MCEVSRETTYVLEYSVDLNVLAILNKLIHEFLELRLQEK